jgi:hypothetical protein
VVGRHGPGQRKNRPLARAVQRPLLDPGGAGDRAHVHDRRGGRPLQRGERGAAGADHPHEVDVQHPEPLGVVVVGHRAARAYTGVVDEDVDPVVRVEHLADRRTHRRVVADVDADAEGPGDRAVRPAGVARLEVQHRHLRAAGEQLADDSRADAGRAAGDRGHQSVEVSRHDAPPR